MVYEYDGFAKQGIAGRTGSGASAQSPLNPLLGATPSRGHSNGSIWRLTCLRTDTLEPFARLCAHEEVVRAAFAGGDRGALIRPRDPCARRISSGSQETYSDGAVFLDGEESGLVLQVRPASL